MTLKDATYTSFDQNHGNLKANAFSGK
uniref:Uncharacterized protein n=1 Tax=Rhizophora mucronata TaxID=61149 RepID=A0A2P2ITQ0_RHIMU